MSTFGSYLRKPGYGSSFSVNENPISESSIWRNGLAQGTSWCNMQVVGGIAYGTQTGNSGLYDDSVAVLTGSWGSDQYVEADVFTTNQQTGSCFEEVELWVRTKIQSGRITGIETNFRCNADGSQYIGVVRWNGPLGTIGQDTSAAFTQYGTNDAGPGIHNGDHIAVEVIGDTHKVYVNGVLITTHDLTTNGNVPQGNPGMGHWLHLNGATGVNVSDYGLRNFRARNI